MNRPDGLHLLSRIGDIDAARWDALLAASSPTAAPGLRHAYLAALEDTGCVGGRTGWTPAHATLWQHGEPIAAMPLYIKDHSYGEYVFDWAWAEAYQRHGLDYYPKWLSALPFTPTPGTRILGRDPPPAVRCSTPFWRRCASPAPRPFMCSFPPMTNGRSSLARE